MQEKLKKKKESGKMKMKKYKKSQVMMATKAMHLLGDISSKTPALCIIEGEDKKNFIGAWVTGPGFVKVNFPKATTRPLSDIEKEDVRRRKFALGGITFSLAELL